MFLFILGMAATFIPEHLREFFGDVNIQQKTEFGMDQNWVWGARHYWFYWMTVALFLLSLVDVIVGITNKVLTYYPKLK
jgi:hypothetical protein